MPHTNTDLIKFDIANCLSELEAILVSYDNELISDKKIDLLKQAIKLSFDINTYFNTSDQMFNQITEVKLLAIDVFRTQIDLQESK